MATFIVSAFWHGFYPFYYVMFFFAAILSEVAKDVFKAKSLFGFIPSALKPFVANFLSFVCMNYLGILQCALTFENGWRFITATYGLVPVSLLILLALSRSLGLVRFAQKLEGKPSGNRPTATAKATDTDTATEEMTQAKDKKDD